MGKVSELLDSIGEDGYPDDFGTTLIGAYDEDMSIPAAKVAELEAANAVLVAQVAELKARNYDLMVASSAVDNDGSDDTDSTDNGDEDITIDDLFGEDE